MVQFCDIRYERSARLVDHLNFKEIHKNRGEQRLNFYGYKCNDTYLSI